jgi:hypothetical protein
VEGHSNNLNLFVNETRTGTTTTTTTTREHVLHFLLDSRAQLACGMLNEEGAREEREREEKKKIYYNGHTAAEEEMSNSISRDIFRVLP